MLTHKKKFKNSRKSTYSSAQVEYVHLKIESLKYILKSVRV